MKPKAGNSGKRNSVRIIAGEWRGRHLSFADHDGLRPSADRIRETLFNWLQYDIAGAHCLDLFAGSGVLGFEALSRGAAAVTSVELARPACAAIEESRARLQADKLRLLHADALNFLQNLPPTRPFDIVFLDPPFASGLLEPACRLLEEQLWLSRDAKIYLEAEQAPDKLQLPGSWQLLKNKKAGKVYYGLAVAGARQD